MSSDLKHINLLNMFNNHLIGFYSNERASEGMDGGDGAMEVEPSGETNERVRF